MLQEAIAYDDPNRKQFINTFSGKKFFFLEPTPCLVDIAHGLAHSCRWSGQGKMFYSIAEHCVLASQIRSAYYPLEKLMHDASEAYTGDICKPLKNLLGDAFKKIEDGIEAAVYAKYCGGPPAQHVKDGVKQADLELALLESRELLGVELYVKGIAPAKVKLNCWCPDLAEEKFLERFKELI